MKKIIRLIPFALLLIGLCIVNYSVDPGCIFHDISSDVANLILDGNDVYVSSKNLNMQELKMDLIKDMPETVDAVCIGASPINGLGKEAVDAEQYMNLAVSGAGYYDMIGQFGLLYLYKKTPKKIIIFVDPSYFCEVIYEYKLVNSENMKPYANYMKSILEGEEIGVTNNEGAVLIKNKLYNLFSLTYFQASMDYIESNDGMIGTRYQVVSSYSDEAYFKSDGSLVYDVSYQSQGVDDVVADSRDYENNYLFNSLSGQPMSKESKDTLERLIEYYDDVNFEIFLAPFAPALYDIYDREKYYVFQDIEDYCKELSDRYANVNVVGSYNPYSFGMSNEDFYDSRHIRRDALKKYFDF